MKILLMKCRRCYRLGVGPNKVKLYPLDGSLYCHEHWLVQLDWHEQRPNITSGTRHERETDIAIAKSRRVSPNKKPARSVNWWGYLYEQCGLMGEALLHGDKRSFTYYGSRALYAWELLREWRRP